MNYIARSLYLTALSVSAVAFFCSGVVAQQAGVVADQAGIVADQAGVAAEQTEFVAPQSDLPTAIRGLPNAGIVSQRLLRSAQLNESQLATLKKAGVKTIINLRDGAQDIATERSIVQKLGMHFVSIPMSSFKPVEQAQVDAFLKTVDDPANQPALVHCRDGEDRTGTLVAIYRMKKEGWTGAAAYQEMLNYGFHPELVTLDQAVINVSKGTGEPIAMPTFSQMANDVERRFENFYQRNFSSSRLNGFNTNF